jgi:hypothetical protein
VVVGVSTGIPDVTVGVVIYLGWGAGSRDLYSRRGMGL